MKSCRLNACVSSSQYLSGKSKGRKIPVWPSKLHDTALSRLIYHPVSSLSLKLTSLDSPANNVQNLEWKPSVEQQQIRIHVFQKEYEG